MTRRKDTDHDEIAAREAWAGLGPRGDPFGLVRRTTRNVTGSGLAALNAVGSRAVRRAAEAGPVDPGARDNWRPTGPRNVTGRIRALAAEPGSATVLYAGSASGGVWKTTDGGQRWFPLWHDDQASLAVGALAVAAPPSRRVYAATGEIRPAGLNVSGHGIWVSDDNGANWTNRSPMVPVPANPSHERGFDAIAVDPANDAHCWAVGGDGIFRTTDAGATWRQVLPAGGDYYSDVAFSDGHLWLARGRSQAGEAALIRLTPPASTAAADLAAVVRPALAVADNLSTVVAAVPAHRARPARIKLAIAPSDPKVAFVRVVDEDDHHVGVFRTTKARAAKAKDVTWERLPDHPDWVEEDFGTYCLCIAVHPTDPKFLATGMMDVHVSTNATAAASSVRFHRAMSWVLYQEDRRFHADNHALVVVGPAPTALWVANDAGIAVSSNWTTGGEVGFQLPLAPGTTVFGRRDLGISASQAYDLNQSPIVPTLYAAGLQDNGVQLTAGGPTWRMVAGGDGGFVLFDPDDAFRFLTTSPEGIESGQFPGHIDRFVPDEQPDVPVLSGRDLSDGFREVDEPGFVADTARHRLRRDRVLHARTRRVYGSRGSRGERWEVEPVGRSFEIVAGSDGDTVEIRILPTDGAVHLGLVPGTRQQRAPFDPLTDRERPRAVAATGSHLPAPWRLADGEDLRLRINGVDAVATFHAADVADITKVTLPEVLRIVGAVLPAGTEILPRMWPRPRAVEIVTRGRGAGQRIQIAGSSLTPLGDGLSRLGLNAGEYRGDDDRPASITLAYEGESAADFAAGRDLSGAPDLVLTVSVNGGAAVPITFKTPEFADPHVVMAGELAAQLAAGLGQTADVVAADMAKAVVLRADPGATVSLSGTAVDRFDLGATEAEVLTLYSPTARSVDRRTHVRNRNSFDLRGGLTLEIRDGPTTTGPFLLTAGPDITDLRAVTVEQLHRVIRLQLAAVPAIRVHADLLIEPELAQAEEITFAPTRPDEAWVGGADGTVFRTTDDGATWSEVGPPDAKLVDAQLEAIAVHPTDSQVAYVGLWRNRPGPADRGLLFRTGDGGTRWDQVGSRRAGANLLGIVGDGRPLGIRALELDPGDPRVVFAATDGGVFRSRDEGATWEPFNHGLPNCPVVDLAMVEGTRTLRATAWGRGTWERRIGADPPDDVRLVVRSSELDDGWTRPPRAGPDVYAAAPTGDPPSSPDIKVVRRRPTGVGADPTVDGVQFDLDLPSDEVVDMPAGLAGPDHQSEIVVQVHNRGSFPARSSPPPPPPPPVPDPAVRVAVLWAPLTGSPPPLPLDFWMRFKTAALQAAEGEWRLAGLSRLPEPVRPDAPAVVGTAVTWPRDIGAPRVGILALVTSDDDVLDGGPTDVAELVALERRAAFRSVDVVPAADDRTLVLRATGPRRFEVRAPAAGPDAPTSVTDRLQIANADLVTPRRRLRSGVLGGATYDLSVARPGVLVLEDTVNLDIDFNNDFGEFRDFFHVTPAEAAAFIHARLENAGVPARAATHAVGIRLRGLGGARVRSVVNTPALGWTNMAVAAAVPQLDARNKNWFNLSGNPLARVEVRSQANTTFELTFRAESFDDPASADPERIALLFNRAIAANRLDGVVRCDVLYGLRVTGMRESQATAIGAGAARLDIGGAADSPGDPGVVSLADAPALRISVDIHETVRFDTDPPALPDLAHVQPQDVRRALNRAFEIAGLSVRAEPGRFRLRIGGSSTEAAGGPAVLGGQGLAEIATSGTVPAPNPAGLFDLRTALATDALTEVAPNHVYVRIANTGNIDIRPARVRLYRVDPTVTPPGVAQVVAGTVDVDAERTAVIDLSLTPAAASGGFEHVIAVVDQDVHGRRAPDPAGADLEALAALCERRPDTAWRTFEVAPP